MTNSVMNPRRMITRPLSFLCHVQNFNVFKLYCFGLLLLLTLALFSMAAFLSAHYTLSRTPDSNKLVKDSQAATEDIYFVGICRRHPTVPFFSPILRYPRWSVYLLMFGGNHLKLNLSKTGLLFILGKDSKSLSRTSQYRLRRQRGTWA